MCYLPTVVSKEEAEFVQILRDVKALTKEVEESPEEKVKDLLEKTVNELFSSDLFGRRVMKFSRAHSRNETEAEDRYQEICLKVAQNILKGFTPNYEKPFGNFFTWLRRLEWNFYIDEIRARKCRIVETGTLDWGSFKAGGASPEILAMRKELFDHIDNLPWKQRLATKMFLNGYSLRESQDEFEKLGIDPIPSHTTIRKWVSAGLKPFCSYAKVAKAMAEWKAERKAAERSSKRSTSKSMPTETLPPIPSAVSEGSKSSQLIEG